MPIYLSASFFTFFSVRWDRNRQFDKILYHNSKSEIYRVNALHVSGKKIFERRKTYLAFRKIEFTCIYIMQYACCTSSVVHNRKRRSNANIKWKKRRELYGAKKKKMRWHKPFVCWIGKICHSSFVKFLEIT